MCSVSVEHDHSSRTLPALSLMLSMIIVQSPCSNCHSRLSSCAFHILCVLKRVWLVTVCNSKIVAKSCCSLVTSASRILLQMAATFPTTCGCMYLAHRTPGAHNSNIVCRSNRSHCHSAALRAVVGVRAVGAVRAVAALRAVVVLKAVVAGVRTSQRAL